MKCERCGRPAWTSGDGMGGSTLPDDETDCISPGNRACRIASEGRRAGLREGLEVVRECTIPIVTGSRFDPTIGGATDWDAAEAEIERRCKEEER